MTERAIYASVYVCVCVGNCMLLCIYTVTGRVLAIVLLRVFVSKRSCYIFEHVRDNHVNNIRTYTIQHVYTATAHTQIPVLTASVEQRRHVFCIESLGGMLRFLSTHSLFHPHASTQQLPSDTQQHPHQHFVVRKPDCVSSGRIRHPASFVRALHIHSTIIRVNEVATWLS